MALHPPSRAAIALFALLAPLAGCVADPTLTRVDPAPRDQVPAEVPPPPLEPSPWDGLDPGALPDVHFAVAYSEDCPPTPGAGCFDVGFALIDLRGQVLAEFRVPGSEAWRPDRLRLHPAGYGQFLVVADRWLVPPVSSGVPAVHEPWQAWLADAVDGSFTQVAAWDNAAGALELPEADRAADLGGWSGYLKAAMLPTEPDWLYVWPGGAPMCGAPLRDLHAVHLRDPDVPDRVWPHEQFVTPAMATRGLAVWPWHFDASADEDGAPSFVFGLSPGFCLDTPEGVASDLVAWSPADGVLWRRELADPWYAQNDLQDAEYSGGRGGGVLRLNSPLDEPGWTVDRPDDSVDGGPGDALIDHRPGTLLDPAGPTLSVIGGHPSGSHDELEVYHRGEVVWTVESLRFGLQARPVWLLDVVRVPEPAE